MPARTSFRDTYRYWARCLEGRRCALAAMSDRPLDVPRKGGEVPDPRGRQGLANRAVLVLSVAAIALLLTLGAGSALLR